MSIFIPEAHTVHLAHNFTLAELVRTQHGRPEDNFPASDQQLASLTRLCTSLLQPIRDEWGPLKITSGFRSPAVNQAVGSSPRSQHLAGEAADFVPSRAGCREVWAWVQRRPFEWGQLILETSRTAQWIHISLKAPGLYRAVLEIDTRREA
jgi:hypothetical protein